MRQVKDRVVQHPHRYKLVPVAGTTDTYDLERVPGTVTEEGTAVNRQLFNSIDSALLCTHSKSGTVHTFTLNSAVAAFVPGQTIYTVKAALTASIEVGDTFTLTDGTTSYTGIVPKTSEGGNYRVTLFQNLSPVVIFEVNLGGSAKHAFFRGGGQKRLYREVFTVSGTWTCPDFVDEVYVQAFGGGGGGGAGGTYTVSGTTRNFGGGGGGGGGYMAQGRVSVTPGTSYAVTIGAGGKGGLVRRDQQSGATNITHTLSAGSNGGATSFRTVSAAGGKGGGAASYSGSSGSAGAGGAGGAGGAPSGASGQFASPSGNNGGNGYGVLSKGGAPGANADSENGVGGAGGGGSYGRGGDGRSSLPESVKQSSYGSTYYFTLASNLLGSHANGEYGGGGGGGYNTYGDIVSGNITEFSSLAGWYTKYSGAHGGDGILFLSYYADPSMMGSRKPEEFDVQTNGTEVSVTAATVAETVETMVAVDETADETGDETHGTNETTQAAEDAAETEENT